MNSLLLGTCHNHSLGLESELSYVFLELLNMWKDNNWDTLTTILTIYEIDNAQSISRELVQSF